MNFSELVEFGNKLELEITLGRQKTPVTLLFQTVLLLHFKKKKERKAKTVLCTWAGDSDKHKS